MLIPISLFLFTLFIYLLTFCATFNINDSGETVMVCDLLTVGHSPGYPLHTLLGHLSCLLPLGQPMLRVNFFSMIAGSTSVALLYAFLKKTLRILPQVEPNQTVNPELNSMPWFSEISAILGALVFAFSYQHWFQSCGAKGGIYTLNT